MEAKQIRQLRKDLGISQIELAKILKTNQTVLSIIETGRYQRMQERAGAYLLAEKAKREASSPQAA